MDNSILSFFNFLIKELEKQYSKQEASYLVTWLLEERLGIKKGTLPFYFEFPLETEVKELVLSDLKRLQQREPIQYILEKGYFLDLELRITPDVLIPRPETEELVTRAINYLNTRRDINKVLEVGTGSGNIAIALAKHLPWVEITTIDIDLKAINLAKENAKRYGVDNRIVFLCQDARLFIPEASFDFLISNPPYVPKGGWVAPQVEKFEPAHAVFSADSEGLEFYKVFFQFFQKGIVSRGVFEIYEDNAFKLMELFKEFSPEIEFDIAGKSRFLWVNR